MNLLDPDKVVRNVFLLVVADVPLYMVAKVIWRNLPKRCRSVW